tara:strand:- start:3347 stop:6442 length:3096 start_codon:yes stop_codon:yes gene_type:complete
MTTQLILFPQNYKGYTSTYIPTPITQFIVDGINFSSINGSISYDNSSANPNIVLSEALTYQHAQTGGISANTWYRVRSTNASTPTLPAQVSNNLLIYGSSPKSLSGVYQRLSNLVVGAVYSLDINMILVAPYLNNSITVIHYNGTTRQHISSSVITAPTTSASATFTPQATNDIIAILLSTTDTTNINITSISATQNIIVPSGIYTDLQDGQVICDLYEEEDIPLTLSIDDFKSVAEKVQSYSKDFNLPATKRNNQIFNNMFEVTRADDGLIFNPYVKTQCVLKQDGFILFEGYLRMIDIKDKEGQISYNVNLYSEVIALADTLKDKTFSHLDLSELTSDYEFDAIQDSWDDTVGLPLDNALSTSSFAYDAALGVNNTNVMKYPFIDWNHQFSLDADSNPVLPNLNSAFRPCINVRYLINKIFSEAGFTWTSNFFDSTDFGKLFMDFNWGNDENPTDVNNAGFGMLTKDTSFTDNFATSSFTNLKLNFNTFSTQQGYDQSTGAFTVPAGQGNTWYSVSYFFNLLFLNYDLPSNIELRWLVTPATGSTYAIEIDNRASGDTAGSAVAYATVNALGQVSGTSLPANQGGYYLSAPTITFQSTTGTGATATCTIDGSGKVDSITIVLSGANYSSSVPPQIVFNGVTPNQNVYTYSGNFTRTLEAGDKLECQMKADTATYGTNAVMQDHRTNPAAPFNNYTWKTAQVSVISNVNTMADQALLNSLRGDLGQWEFLRGLMTMFNLVSMADDTNKKNIIIEPYSDIFIKNTNSNDVDDLTLATRSIEHDWTDKVDVSEMELRPLTDLNKNTVFKFVEDDDDYCFNAYKMATSGGLYGAKYWDASGFTILAGNEEIIAEPFAATVMKPLQSHLSNFIVPSIYSVDDSGASEGFDNSPRILYDNGIQTVTGFTYSVPAQNGTAAVAAENQFLQFSHLSEIPINPTTTTDFNFESDQLIQPLDANGMPSSNLFNTYWLPYFAELYSADTRVMTLRVNLSPADVATFKFYDTVMIKNRTFRVNKIDYKPNSLAKVEFILIP